MTVIEIHCQTEDSIDIYVFTILDKSKQNLVVLIGVSVRKHAYDKLLIVLDFRQKVDQLVK